MKITRNRTLLSVIIGWFSPTTKMSIQTIGILKY